ncbi:MAG: TOBE domain-containing protein, partial [Stackebrandtia sp.]
ALSMADQVMVMRDGRLRQVGTPQEVYDSPADPWVADFVGEAMLLDGVVDDGTASTAVGAAPLCEPVADGRATVLIRPEQIELTSETDGEIRARVVDVSFFGHDALVRLRLNDGAPATARTLGARPAPGAEVGLRVKGAVRAYPLDA